MAYGPRVPFGISYSKSANLCFHVSLDDVLHFLSPLCCMYPASNGHPAGTTGTILCAHHPRSHTSTEDVPGTEQSLAERVSTISDPGWRTGSRALGCGCILTYIDIPTSVDAVFVARQVLIGMAMADPNAVLRETFSYVEPCLRAWEGNRPLRQLGITGVSLIVGEDSNGVIPPNLANIRANYTLLKGYTQHMANTGLIITKLIGYIQPPVLKFYELMEIDVATNGAKAVIYAASYIIKKMLHVVRRKWARWEMPRVT